MTPRKVIRWQCHLCDTGWRWSPAKNWQADIIDHIDWRHAL